MSLGPSLLRASSSSLLMTLALAASFLACNDDGDALDPQVEGVASPSEEAIILRPSLCTTVLCAVGSQCNPKTGQCEAKPDGGLVLPSDFGSCGTHQPVCPAGTFCMTVACTNSIPPNCFGVCTKR